VSQSLAINSYQIHPDTTIIVDSMYGCEEAAVILDSMGYTFIMSCKASRPSYLFTMLHNKITNHGDYSWVARKGKTNTLFAISLWNSGGKKKIVNWIANFGHPDEFKGDLMDLQQFYVKFMGAVDKVNQGIHLYPFGHRTIKWTHVPFHATLSFSAWNAIMSLGFQNSHELYKDVLVKIAHLFGPIPLKHQNISNIPLTKFTQNKHALSTPLQSFDMKESQGYCIRCTRVDNIKRKTKHYCVHCSNGNEITWFCKECFEWVHSNPKYIRKPLFLTAKPLSTQVPLYNS